jgi:hypothetical protein
MALDGIGQRLQQGGGLADPIGKGRAVEIDTLTPEDLRLSDVSAYGTNQRDYLREDFWLIVVTEGNADETEIADTSDWCGQGDQGHPPGNA